jgi:hypothetical protein
MKVYVVFEDYGLGGDYSRPVGVYASEDSAKKHAKEKNLTYDEMEVEK